MPTHCGQQGRALSCVGRRAYALGVGAAAPPNRCPHRGRPRSPLSPQSQGFHPQGHLTAGLLSMSPPHPAVWAPHHCTDGQGACASWQPESIILPSPAPSPGLLQVSEGGGIHLLHWALPLSSLPQLHTTAPCLMPEGSGTNHT